MLHRLLFVAGMTVGVMMPLLWAAYVSRPSSPTSMEKTAKVVSEARAPAEDVIASIRPAPVPRPKPGETPPATTRSIAEASAESARAHPTTPPAGRRDKERFLPAVVDSYNGAHVITVCAALTDDEQLRAGCP